MIPANASIEQLLETFNDPNFVAHGEIDLHVESSRGDLAQVYAKNVELMAKLDGYSLTVADEMSRALQDLKKSEKRTKYQFDLLKSDVVNFEQRQAQMSKQVRATVAEGLHNDAVQELAALGAKKQQIQRVHLLLDEASRGVKNEQTDKVTKLR